MNEPNRELTEELSTHAEDLKPKKPRIEIREKA